MVEDASWWVHYPRGRLRYHSERPTAIADVPVEASPGSYRTGDIPLGTPTTSARTRRGLWALYPAGGQVVVVHPGGAVAGPPAEVATELERLLAGLTDPLERHAVRAMRALLAGDGAAMRAAVCRWSRPAVGYWVSGPDNAPRRRSEPPAPAAQPSRRIAAGDGERPQPAERRIPAEPLRPAA
jgi:hypothetical protein